MISRILKQFNITNYRYDVIDGTLIIYESILVENYIKMKQEFVLNKCKVENLIIKRR